MTPAAVAFTLRRGLTEPDCDGYWLALDQDGKWRTVEVQGQALLDRSPPGLGRIGYFTGWREFCGPLPSAPPESGDVVAAERARATKIAQEFESVWRGIAEAASDERARLQAHAKAEVLGQVAARIGGTLALDLDCRSQEMRRFVDDYAMNALLVEAWRQDELASVLAEYERCAKLAATWGHSIPPPGKPPTRDEVPAELRPTLLALVDGGRRLVGRLSGVSPAENRLAGLGLVALELHAFAWWVVATPAGRDAAGS